MCTKNVYSSWILNYISNFISTAMCLVYDQVKWRLAQCVPLSAMMRLYTVLAVLGACFTTWGQVKYAYNSLQWSCKKYYECSGCWWAHEKSTLLLLWLKYHTLISRLHLWQTFCEKCPRWFRGMAASQSRRSQWRTCSLWVCRCPALVQSLSPSHCQIWGREETREHEIHAYVQSDNFNKISTINSIG